MKPGLRAARSIVCASVVAALAMPASSGAAILAPFGSDLSATPTMDTANGATGANPAGTAPLSSPWVYPDPHDAADAVFWNTALPNNASNTAPQGGQVLEIKVKGCAVEDTTAPVQTSQMPGGPAVPVNTVNFQTLTPQGDGTYKQGVVSAYNLLPFCSDSADTTQGAVTTSTITTFQPVHMCIDPGQLVDFYDIGGFIQQGSSFWYPQGVPFKVLAPVVGSSMESFVDPTQTQYGPGMPTGDPKEGGFGQEPGEEVLLQVIEGTGDNAYGLCPGGKANEPSSTSNDITCVFDNNPEPGAAPPCPGYGSGTGSTSTGTPSTNGTTATGGTTGQHSSPTIAGKPTLSHVLLAGAGSRRPVLRFRVSVGKGEAALRSLIVGLPRGVAFASRARLLAGHLSVLAGGRRVGISRHFAGRALVITLRHATPSVQVKISSPAITVTPTTANKASARKVGSLTLSVTATDAAGARFRLRASLNGF